MLYHIITGLFFLMFTLSAAMEAADYPSLGRTVIMLAGLFMLAWTVLRAWPAPTGG